MCLKLWVLTFVLCSCQCSVIRRRKNAECFHCLVLSLEYQTALNQGQFKLCSMHLNRCSLTEVSLNLERKETVAARSTHFTCHYFINRVLGTSLAVIVNGFRPLSVFAESERADVSLLLHRVSFFH